MPTAALWTRTAKVLAKLGTCVLLFGPGALRVSHWSIESFAAAGITTAGSTDLVVSKTESSRPNCSYATGPIGS